MGNVNVSNVDYFERFDCAAGVVTPRVFSVDLTQINVTRFDGVNADRWRHGTVLANAALLKGRAEKY